MFLWYWPRWRAFLVTVTVTLAGLALAGITSPFVTRDGGTVTRATAWWRLVAADALGRDA